MIDFIYLLPSILIAITIHEFAHAITADKLGDPTPRLDGRITLNPLKHIDLIGFLLFLIFKFGWARPVVINPHYFRNPLRDSAIVAFAGPLSNLVLAFVSLLIVKFIPFYYMKILILINIYLAFFNLIPLPPLDGWRILSAFFPNLAFNRTAETYGFIALLALVLLGNKIISTYLSFSVDLFFKIFNL
jgi:Zn-dependent protease